MIALMTQMVLLIFNLGMRLTMLFLLSILYAIVATIESEAEVTPAFRHVIYARVIV